MSGTDYFKNHGRELECPICTRRFPAIYHTKEMQRPKKIYGTKTLMSLWAYYNFLRHLKSHDESRLEVIEDEVTEKTEPKKGGPRREGNKVIEG